MFGTPRRRISRWAEASVVEIRSAGTLPFREVALGRQPALLCPPRGPGRPARLLDVQRIGDTDAEPLHGQLPIADLRSLIVRHDADLRAQAIEQPRPLPRPQRRGPRYVESQLHPGVHLVGMLASGAATRAEPELQLGEGKGQ